MCKIEEQLENESKMPTFYKRYVDDTLETATEFFYIFLNTILHNYNQVKICILFFDNSFNC